MEIKKLLEYHTQRYNKKWFVLDDPISIPHQFKRKEDIEIAGFLTATLSWGQRTAILKKANLLMQLLEMAPYEFITSAPLSDFERFNNFVYRTFNGVDCQYFISTLREIYLHHNGLEQLFNDGYKQNQTIHSALVHFRTQFMKFNPMPRTGKHVANVLKGSSAKRLNMFLRWMVRNDGVVDFGLWKNIPTSALMIPLDIHVGRVARNLGLLQRKQNDWKAVEELTQNLQFYAPNDPVKYDYALFGLGVYGEKY